MSVQETINMMKLLHLNSVNGRQLCDRLRKENKQQKKRISELERGVAPSKIENDELRTLIDHIKKDASNWRHTIEEEDEPVNDATSTTSSKRKRKN